MRCANRMNGFPSFPAVQHGELRVFCGGDIAQEQRIQECRGQAGVLQGQEHIIVIKRVCKILLVRKVIMETAEFDMQRMRQKVYREELPSQKEASRTRRARKAGCSGLAAVMRRFSTASIGNACSVAGERSCITTTLSQRAGADPKVWITS